MGLSELRNLRLFQSLSLEESGWFGGGKSVLPARTIIARERELAIFFYVILEGDTGMALTRPPYIILRPACRGCLWPVIEAWFHQARASAWRQCRAKADRA